MCALANINQRPICRIGRRLLSTAVVMMCALVACAQSLVNGTGFLDLTSYAPFRQKPVRVYYHIPDGATTNMPILMTLHGDERDGNSYRQSWIAAANQHRFIVLAPEFSDANYGGGNGYNLLNMFSNGDNPSLQTLNPDSVWTSAWFEHIFRFFKQQTGSVHDKYVVFAHSAGAQVLHKYLYYYPQSSISTAISANAGWYTMPSTTVNYPYGVRLTRADQDALKQAFARKLIVLLGLLDNNPNSSGLRHTSEADAQGLHRLARGRYFFSFAQSEAGRMQTPFSWQKVEVAGVGHNHQLMAVNALPLVLDAFRQDFSNSAVGVLQSYYSEGNLYFDGLQLGELVNLAVIDAVGHNVYTYSGYTAKQVTVSVPLRPGVYVARINTSYHADRMVRFITY